MKATIYILITLLCTCYAFPQHHKMHPDFPADTSYNSLNELKKHSKKYPFITVSEVEKSAEVKAEYNIVYEKTGLRDLHLDVFKPANIKKKTPLIIMIHGGGWRSGNKDMDHHMAVSLAKNGYSVICVEYRLSMEAKYPAALRDVKTAIRWARANADKYRFDKNKFAIMGCSSGAQMASLIGSINNYYLDYQSPTLAEYSDKVQAVINFDGVLAFIHPQSSEGNDKPDKPSAATLWFGYSVNENSRPYTEASALTHAGRQSAPFIFINSSQPRFSAGQKELIDILNKNNIYNEEHLIKDSPHSYWLFHPWVDEAIKLTVDFLRKVF